MGGGQSAAASHVCRKPVGFMEHYVWGVMLWGRHMCSEHLTFLMAKTPPENNRDQELLVCVSLLPHLPLALGGLIAWAECFLLVYSFLGLFCQLNSSCYPRRSLGNDIWP